MPGLGAAIAATFATWTVNNEGSYALERAIYGTAEPDAIAACVNEFCRSALGSGIDDYLFYHSSIGSVSGVRLVDGREVVIKAHPPTQPRAYLTAMHRVLQHLTARGFPCPPIVLGPMPLGHGHAVVEELVDEGELKDAHDPAVRRILAELLARLVQTTWKLGDVPGLEAQGVQRRSPDDLWPIPHSAIFNFEATASGAEWIDQIAARARRVLTQAKSRPVIAHTDWGVKHFRFIGDTVRVIYDWDSLRLVQEADLTGGAAAGFTYTEYLDGPRWPTTDEARAFVHEYEAARGAPFSSAEWDAINAAATYSRAYSARCEHAIAPQVTKFPPGSLRDMLTRYGGDDLRW